LRNRGRANALATTTNWAANFIVSVTFLSYVDLVGKSGAFWTYGGFGIICWIFMYFKLVETKGKKLEDIQKELIRGHLEDVDDLTTIQDKGRESTQAPLLDGNDDDV